MSDKLPIIDELEKATTFAEMAEWLTACPLAVFASHGNQIEALVSARGFGTAQTYVSQYIADVHRTRSGRFHAFESGVQFDSNGTCSEDLKGQAQSLDGAARATAALDLSWHTTRQMREADNAG